MGFKIGAQPNDGDRADLIAGHRPYHFHSLFFIQVLYPVVLPYLPCKIHGFTAVSDGFAFRRTWEFCLFTSYWAQCERDSTQPVLYS